MNEKSFFERLVHKIFESSIVFDIFRRILHRNFFKEKSILFRELNLNKLTMDFGCGTGPYSTIFSKPYYLGVDIDPKNIIHAKRRYSKDFLVINGKNFKNIKKKIHQIFAIDVFHHLPDEAVKHYVPEFERLLPKHGILLILEHFPVNDQTNFFGKYLLKRDRGKYVRSKEDLLSFFSKSFICEKTYNFYAAGYKDYVLFLRRK